MIHKSPRLSIYRFSSPRIPFVSQFLNRKCEWRSVKQLWHPEVTQLAPPTSHEFFISPIQILLLFQLSPVKSRLNESGKIKKWNELNFDTYGYIIFILRVFWTCFTLNVTGYFRNPPYICCNADSQPVQPSRESQSAFTWAAIISIAIGFIENFVTKIFDVYFNTTPCIVTSSVYI